MEPATHAVPTDDGDHAGNRGSVTGFVDAFIGFAVTPNNGTEQQDPVFPADRTVEGILTLFRRVPPTSTRDVEINAMLSVK